MIHTFQSIDHFLFGIEKEIIDTLYDYDLLSKFDNTVKKIIFYIFLKRIGEQLESHDLLFYHTGQLSDLHELCQHYEKEKLEEYINKICNKIRKSTNRLFFIKQKITLPNESLISDLEGSVIDEIYLLKEKKPIDPKKLKEFLKKNYLKDIFGKLSKKVC